MDELMPGIILIADPFLKDPNFLRTPFLYASINRKVVLVLFSIENIK